MFYCSNTEFTRIYIQVEVYIPQRYWQNTRAFSTQSTWVGFLNSFYSGSFILELFKIHIFSVFTSVIYFWLSPSLMRLRQQRRSHITTWVKWMCRLEIFIFLQFRLELFDNRLDGLWCIPWQRIGFMVFKDLDCCFIRTFSETFPFGNLHPVFTRASVIITYSISPLQVNCYKLQFFIRGWEVIVCDN